MKYIILELIPTSLNPEKGEIIQLSALKIDNLEVVDRFDYRLCDEKVPNDSFLDIISYDKDCFIYKDSKEEIINDFKLWIEDTPLLIIDNDYTNNYLVTIENTKESIVEQLNMEYSDDFIDKVIEKYKLIPSNSIVDLLYLALTIEKGAND